MYRVIIVDDEEPVLDSFSFILQKDVSDFILCGKARSGTEAVALIKELSPDLVFMDIQMPGIDGLEAISRVRTQFPDTVFILATAYERFDIAKKAIPLGVFSYMVKPISRRALLDKLKEVKIHLDQIQEQSSKREEVLKLLRKTQADEKKKFLSSLIFKNPTPEEWQDFTELFSFTSEKAALYLIGISGNVSDEVKEELYPTITRKVQYKQNCCGSSIGGRLLLLIPEEKGSPDLLLHLETIFKEFDNFDFILGAGNRYHFSELTNSFSEAFKPFAYAAEKEKTWLNERKKAKDVCRAILKAGKKQGEELFEKYWIEKFNTDSFDVAKGKMIALFTLLIQDIDSHLLINGNFKIEVAEEIMPMKTIEQWREWVSRTFSKLQELLEMHRNNSYPDPLIKAITHIRENYSKQIQLSSVAEVCLVSSSYLSRLFSEHLDTTFIDYVNRYRLNEAMILLKDKNISIKETSYLVGYQDPNYFSRIFRKYMGVSPSDLEKRRAMND